MKIIDLSRVAGAALAAALVAFTAAPSFGNEGEVTSPPEGSDLRTYAGPVKDAYRIFVTGEAPASTPDVADGGYGSQGFHHGLPTTATAGDVFAVDMIPYSGTPDSAAIPQVEPVAGGAEALRDAGMFTYVPDADYGSLTIEHWMPNNDNAD
jgi:hypothetical protein